MRGHPQKGRKKKLDICTVKGLWACQFRSGIKNKQTRLYKFPIPNTSLSPRTQCLVICPGWYTLHHHSLLQICFILYSSRECSQCKTWSYSFFTLHAFTQGKLLAATVGVMVMEVRRGQDPAGAVFAPLFFSMIYTPRSFLVIHQFRVPCNKFRCSEGEPAKDRAFPGNKKALGWWSMHIQIFLNFAVSVGINSCYTS